ncbi:hypothetical protein X975_22537, partial [Stegodyphus mimosarum]
MRAAIKPAVVFDGKNSVTSFLESLKTDFQLYPVPERQKVAIALQGQAESSWKGNFENFKVPLLKAFPIVKNCAKLEAELNSFYQRKVEHLAEFILLKVKLVNMLYRKKPDNEVIEIILPRLLPAIQDFMELRNPRTLEELFELAVKFQNRRIAENSRFPTQGTEFLRLANVTINFAENSIFLDMVPKVVEDVKVPNIDFQHLKQDEKAKLEQLKRGLSQGQFPPHHKVPHPRKSKEPKKLQVSKPTEEFRRKESLNVWKIQRRKNLRIKKVPARNKHRRVMTRSRSRQSQDTSRRWRTEKLPQTRPPVEKMKKRPAEVEGTDQKSKQPRVYRQVSSATDVQRTSQ